MSPASTLSDTQSDSECRSLSISQRMQEILYQTADAGVSLSDSGCRSISIRQRRQESLYQTADAEVSLSDSGCMSLSIRQRTRETLYQTADAEVSLSNSGCRSLSIRQLMQKTQWLHLIECLLHPALRDSCIRCLIERLLHLLSDRVSPASAV